MDETAAITDHGGVCFEAAGDYANGPDEVITVRWVKSTERWGPAWQLVLPQAEALAAVVQGVLNDGDAVRGEREAVVLNDTVGWMVDGLAFLARHMGDCA